MVMRSNKFKTGFTVVEVLIVIGIIGILASLATVTYQGHQKRARDAVRKADVVQIAEALEMYHAKTGNFIGNGSGCGWRDTGTGYLSYTDGADYQKSIAQCLQDKGFLPQIPTDPKGPGHSSTPTNNNYSYMKYSCFINGVERAYVFAKLETLPQGDIITNPDVCSHTIVDTSWGMNYYIEVN